MWGFQGTEPTRTGEGLLTEERVSRHHCPTLGAEATPSRGLIS